jgi:transcriptional regulator with GAF, ATPase, and Fis domain
MDEIDICRRALRALSETSFEGAAGALLDGMVEATGADRGFLLVPEGGALRTLARRAAPRRDLPEDGPSEAIVRRALETQAPVRLRNALEHPEFRGRPSVLAISVLSILAVPVVAEGRALAVVYLDSVRVAGIFRPEAEAAAAALAAAVAPGIRNAGRLAALEAAAPPAAPILGRSPAFAAALERALKAAASDAPILLLGESGTGKELFARAIHAASRRAGRPFVAVNAGALPEGTLEAELFGHARGAFTGAVQDRAGRFEAADGGTLFLDEAGDMPPSLQVKLLRALATGEIQKLGSPRERRVDVRVLAATHRDLRALVREGRFREDLFWRLCVVAVEIPPLRARRDDVLLLAEAFAQRFGREQGRTIAGLTSSAREALLRHAFPGNVRELENAIRHAVVFAGGARITAADLPPEIGAGGLAPTDAPPRDADDLRRAKEDAVARLERAFIASVLERAGGNVARAARIAGMNRCVLHQLMARHGARAADFREEARP